MTCLSHTHTQQIALMVCVLRICLPFANLKRFIFSSSQHLQITKKSVRCGIESTLYCKHYFLFISRASSRTIKCEKRILYHAQMLECAFMKNFEFNTEKFKYELRKTFDQRIFSYFKKQFFFRRKSIELNRTINEPKWPKKNLNISRDHKTILYEIRFILKWWLRCETMMKT